MTETIIASVVLDKALRLSLAEGVPGATQMSLAVRSLSPFPSLLARRAIPRRRKRLQSFTETPTNFRRCP
jgi:hypothetical protein